jgi:hypothetical protein
MYMHGSMVRRGETGLAQSAAGVAQVALFGLDQTQQLHCRCIVGLER